MQVIGSRGADWVLINVDVGVMLFPDWDPVWCGRLEGWKGVKCAV